MVTSFSPPLAGRCPPPGRVGAPRLRATRHGKDDEGSAQARDWDPGTGDWIDNRGQAASPRALIDAFDVLGGAYRDRDESAIVARFCFDEHATASGRRRHATDAQNLAGRVVAHLRAIGLRRPVRASRRQEGERRNNSNTGSHTPTNSRPISIRRISFVPAPMSSSFASR